jgi:hypothetical protein
MNLSLPRPTARRLALLSALALQAGACAKVPTQSASMQAAPEVSSSAALVQLQAFETGRAISTLIESAADSIQAASTDVDVRRNALLLKISAIPLVQEAALRIDPVIAAADLYAFTIQFSDYLETGAGKTSFGAGQPVAVAAAAAAEQAALDLVSGNLRSGQLSANSEAYLRTWAADHPMQGPALRRASFLSSDWKALGLSDNSLTASVGNMERTLVNMTYRLSYLNETLAAQARWNAELAGGEALRAPRVDSLVGTVGTSLGSVGTFADEFPAFLDGWREALMRDVDRQRVLAFEAVADQRVALEAALNLEREVLMRQVREERIAAFLSIDSVTVRTLDRSAAILRRLIFQVALSAAAVVALLLGGGFVLFSRWRAASLQRAPSGAP